MLTAVTVDRSMSSAVSLERQPSNDIQTINLVPVQQQQQEQQQTNESKPIDVNDINPSALPSYSNLPEEPGEFQAESPPVYNDLFHDINLDNNSFARV